MALSGSTNYNLTATKLIELAYQEIGDTPIGQGIPGELLTYGMDKLNILLKHLRNLGVHLYIRTNISFAPVNAQFKYTIGPSGANVTAPRPFNLIDAYYRKTSDKINQPLAILTRDQYFGQTARESTSNTSERITQVFYDPTLTNGELYVYPIPNATAASSYTIELYVLRQFDDIDAPSDDIQIPPHMYRAVLLQLAYDLSLPARLSMHERATLNRDADRALTEALDADQEESIFLQPGSNR